MKFKDKETKTKIRRVDIPDIEITKPARVELTQAEYDLLANVFKDAVGRTDIILERVMFTGRATAQPLEPVDAALVIEKI
jgi:hypothetical protein